MTADKHIFIAMRCTRVTSGPDGYDTVTCENKPNETYGPLGRLELEMDTKGYGIEVGSLLSGYLDIRTPKGGE